MIKLDLDLLIFQQPRKFEKIDELEKGIINLKDMATGEQEEVALDVFASYVAEKSL